MIGFKLPLAAGAGLMLAAQPADTYYQLHYDYEAAAQCGLVTAAVERAFRKKRAAADAASSLAPDALKKIRIRAYVAAEREYDNRGLGGHKQWCRGEVREGVRRILLPAP